MPDKKLSLDDAKKLGLDVKDPQNEPSAETKALQACIEEIKRLTAEASGLKKNQVLLDLSPLESFLKATQEHVAAVEKHNAQLMAIIMGHNDEEYKFTFRTIGDEIQATARVVPKRVN